MSNPHHASTLIHPTYRHLDRPIRIAGLTLLQWALLTAAGCGAWLLAQLLPFSSTYDVSIALSVTGAPAAIAIAAGTAEMSPFRYLGDVIRWRQSRGIYERRDSPAFDDAVALWD